MAGQMLHTEAEIRAAGAALGESLRAEMTDAHVAQVVALLAPVRDLVCAPVLAEEPVIQERAA